MKTNPVSQAIQIVGTQKKLAALLGRKQQTVAHWIKSGLPAKYVLPLEKALNGRITRHELRPDIYPLESSDQIN